MVGFGGKNLHNSKRGKGKKKGTQEFLIHWKNQIRATACSERFLDPNNFGPEQFWTQTIMAKKI